MIRQESDITKSRKQAPALALTIAGAAIIIAALFTDDSGGLVAFGSSLITVGVALKARNN